MRYLSRKRIKKNYTKRFMAAFLASALCLTSVPAFAGNLTFSHGNNNTTKRAFGRTTSTTVETKMRNELTVTLSSGASYLRIGESNNASICYVESDNLSGLSGSSYCVYRVNGNVVHRSTKAYPFNF